MKERLHIGVLADTHMLRADEAFSALPEGLFSDVSMVLHAGDIGNPNLLDIFFDKDVFAVWGNMDADAVLERYPASQIVSAGPLRIGLIHGWGRGNVMSRARDAFQDVDVIVFGHTHVPACVEMDGVLMFNPGSFIKNRQGPFPRTAGILTVFEDGSVRGEIFPIAL